MKRNQNRRPKPLPSSLRASPIAPSSAPGGGGLRKWLFRFLAAILGPLLILAALELGLRLAHYGYPTTFFQTISVDGKESVVENDQFSWRFFPRQLARHPLPVSFSPRKPAGTYRIFVLGESAAMGDPEPAFGFSRVLEVLLRERYPEVRFEVINVAFTAINSHVILPIARECARQHGDLWLVYMGHNEVHGPFGPGSIFAGARSRLWLIRSALAIKTTRIGQWLTALYSAARPHTALHQTWHGLEMLLNNEISQQDPRLEVTYRQFQRNLDDILRAARGGEAEVILCPPPSNLKDSGPFASVHAPALKPEDRRRWDEPYLAAQTAQAAGGFDKAIGLLQAAAAVDGQFAELHFQLGQCLLAKRQPQSALSSFERARDLDALRLRADSRLQDLIVQTAARWQGRGVYLCDTRQALAQGSADSIPGQAQFFDHVHLQFDGNYLVARALADQVSQRLPASLRTGERVGWADSALCARRLALTDWGLYQMQEAMQRRLSEAPFTNQSNHLARHRQFAEKLNELRPALTRAGLEAAAKACREALASSPEDGYLHEQYARVLMAMNDDAAARAEFQRLTGLWPRYPVAFYNLGLLQENLGQVDEANQNFHQALAIRPDFADAHYHLGLLAMAKSDFGPTIAFCQQALHENPDLAEAQLTLGQALQASGKMDEAQASYLKALQIRSNSAPAHLAIADLLLQRGKALDSITHLADAARLQPESTLRRCTLAVEQQPQNAFEFFKLANILAAVHQPAHVIENLRTAVRLKTDFWEARYLLGVELATRGNVPEAESQFAAVVQLHPEFALAHLNLGVALAKQLRLPEAATQFQEVLRLEPTNAAAGQFLRKIESLRPSTNAEQRYFEK